MELPGFMLVEPGIQAVQLPLSYIISLIIYSPAVSPGAILTPPLEVAIQLRQIMCFYFDAFFASSADEVRLYSAASPSLSHVFTSDRPRGNTAAQGFPGFLRKLLRLERKAYVTVQRCIAAHEHALLSLLHHPELAYSLLVFGLESLVQEFDGFTPKWSDLAKDYRSKLDDLLSSVEESKAEALREAIVENQHLKLQQRVLSFVSKHVPDSYFEARGGPPSPRVRRSTFELALKGAYELRSRYAHSLMRSEDIQSRSEIAVFYDAKGERKIAFTMMGLQRLFRQVVGIFIEKQVESDEFFNYEASVERPPGSFLVVSPEYWLKEVQGLTAESARHYFEGLLYSYDQRILSGQPTPKGLGVGPNGLWILSILRDSPPDLELIGRRATELLRGASRSQKNLLMAIQVLCGAVEGFEHGHVPKCTPELLSATVARAWPDSPWGLDQIETTLNSLLSRPADVIFPDLMEIIMMLYASFMWQKSGDQEKAMAWLKRAMVECASYPDLQVAIEIALSLNQTINPFERFKPLSQAKKGNPEAPSNTIETGLPTDGGSGETASTPTSGTPSEASPLPDGSHEDTTGG